MRTYTSSNDPRRYDGSEGFSDVGGVPEPNEREGEVSSSFRKEEEETREGREREREDERDVTR